MNEPQLQSLLEGFQDGELSEDECRRLMEWLDEDESRLKEFSDELRLGNALSALHLVDSDSVAITVRDSLFRSRDTIDVSQDVRQQLQTRNRDSDDRTKQSKTFPRKRTSSWIAMAAIAASILVGIVTLAPDPSGGVTAQVVASSSATVSGLEASPQIGDELHLNRFRLESGSLTLMLTSSVRVELIAPAEIEFENDMRLRLYNGRLSADVGDRGKGFTVVTDAGKVIDLGTRFSVEADRHGESRVAVFSGVVEFHPQNSIEHGEFVTLTEGEALRFYARAGLRRWQQVALEADRAGLSGAADFGVVQEVRDNLGEGDLRPFYGVIAGGMRPGALAFTDKPNPVWMKTPVEEFPTELKGADLVRTYYRFRNKKDYELTISLSGPADVFVLVVIPGDPPAWLVDRFEPTGTRVRSGPWHQGLASHPAVVTGQDGNFLEYEVWKCKAGSGELTLGPPQVNTLPGGGPLMYGVAVKARNNE